jgi:eukaryotic-like serine/threonine-protein kinase
MAEGHKAQRNSHQLKFADFTVDLQAGELRRNGTRVRLQEQPFQVLALLTQRAGEVVTREELRKHLWPADTFVDFDNSLNASVAKIREALADSPEAPQFIETLPRRGYRFIAEVEIPRNGKVVVKPPVTPEMPATQRVRWLVLGALLAGIVLGGAGYWAKQHFTLRLTDKDTIVLADFDNSTGDPVFDDTLKQALVVQLQQSPFLSLFPDQQVRETMQLMERSPNEHVTGPVAQEICQRQGASVVLQGAIRGMGTHYVLGLNALNCHTGAPIAQEQVEVERKEQVLAALGSMASRLRSELGESLASVEKHDTSVLQATTSSLEALKAYSLGVPEQEVFNTTAAIPFLKRAIELDPNFALAYAKLAIVYSDAGEDELARQYVGKAFALRDRISTREQFFITALYHDLETRNLEKKIEADRLWARTYPREWFPHVSLAFDYGVIGSFDQALEESEAAVRVDPRSAYGSTAVAGAYLGLNRWKEAKAALEPLIARGENGFYPYCFLYMSALAEGDQQAMQQYLEAAKRKLRDSDKKDFQLMQSAVAAFYGQFRTMRQFSDAAQQIAETAGFKQNVASILAQQALWEAQVGDLKLARERAREALEKASGIDVNVKAAVSLALAGDLQHAEMMVESLAKLHPEDTLLNAVSIPLIRSAIQLEQGNARRAIDLLKSSNQYELGIGYLYYAPFMPTYMRGQAYLKARDGSHATAEFHRILEHRGVDAASPTYALAQLGLARAEKLTGDLAGARVAYEDFLTLWKDADTEIPVLKQARAEYVKLR